MMSCIEGTNKIQFLDEVAKLSIDLMGKKYYELTYDYKDHNTISRWLF